MEWLLVALLALYPVSLSDRDVPPPVVRNVQPNPRAEYEKPRPSFVPTGIGAIDRKAFLHRFEDQAGAELIACLRSSVEETGSLVFVARLHKTGRVTRSASGTTLSRFCGLCGACC